MNTPTPADHEIEAELRAVLLAESARITPDPALHRILERAHAGDRPTTNRRRRRWLPAVAGAVATAGIAAAAVVIFAPGDDGSRPNVNQPTASEVLTLRTGEQVDLAVWFQNQDDQLVSGDFAVTSSGDVGLDAVQLLLQERPRGMINSWTGVMAPKPVARVNDVTHDGDTVTVDFDRQLDPLPSLSSPEFGRPVVQQLVLTVQSALRTDDPVLLTVNGEAADEAFGYPLSGPLEADWSLVSGIRPTSPSQGETVSSPVSITGESSTFEGNVLWQITSDDRVAKKGYTTGGAFGLYDTYTIKAALPPGDYTVKLWEPNAASGNEAWTDELSVVYVDFTVE
ncbi:MAG TPA: Gmad2 immunoglobulin-like domain-containing protein [Nocardioidaceae bacterium]|nr:Gmad2 immunoglobulin-like domain-containing protein [Nocardioidaceae bacterium]